MSSARGKKDPLAKRIPVNPKYKDVKATVDTGASITKYMNKIEEIRRNYKFKKDEIFKRMKVTTFLSLVVQVYQINAFQEIEDIPETPADRPDTADAEVLRIQKEGPDSPTAKQAGGDAETESESARSTLQSVIGGCGELDINAQTNGAPPPTAPPPTADPLPYLLLDIRDADEFQQCHIISSFNYPKSFLSRSVNYETKEMLAYKNIPGKIIVMYDEDERIAHNAATTLVQRGYDNLFMLSGGLKMAMKLVPEGLTTGTPPQSITGVKPKNVVQASLKEFTEDDINKVEMYLDNALEDKSTGSSRKSVYIKGRLSKATTASSRMSARSNASTASSSAITDRPAFR